MAQLVSSVERGRKDIRWQKERSPWDGQDTLDRLLGSGIPAKGISPWNSDVVDLDAARLSETKADVVPVVREDNRWLVCGSQSEYVFVGAFVDLSQSVLIGLLNSEALIVVYPFKNRQIRYHTASVEVLESVEEDVIAIIRNLLVVIPRIDGTTDEVIILGNQLLRPLLLFIRANDISCPAPEQMIAEKHAKGAISFGDFTNHSISHIPPLFTTAILPRA